MNSFLAELRRRKVFNVAIAYAVVAWVLIQIVVSVKGPLRLPEWADTLIIVILAVGFPLAVILAWVFDRTPDGIVRTPTKVAAGEAVQASADEVPSIAVLPGSLSKAPAGTTVIPLLLTLGIGDPHIRQNARGLGVSNSKKESSPAPRAQERLLASPIITVECAVPEYFLHIPQWQAWHPRMKPST